MAENESIDETDKGSKKNPFLSLLRRLIEIVMYCFASPFGLAAALLGIILAVTVAALVCVALWTIIVIILTAILTLLLTIIGFAGVILTLAALVLTVFLLLFGLWALFAGVDVNATFWSKLGKKNKKNPQERSSSIIH